MELTEKGSKVLIYCNRFYNRYTLLKFQINKFPKGHKTSQFCHKMRRSLYSIRKEKIPKLNLCDNKRQTLFVTFVFI